MSPQATKAFLVQLYAAFAAGDMGPSLEAAHEDIIFEIVGPTSLFAFCGPRRGKANAVEAIRQIAQQFKLESMDIDRVLVDDDAFCVQMQARYTQRSNGKSIKVDLVDIGRLKHGKIISLKEYWDIEKAVMELSGRGLFLAAPLAC